MHLGLTYDLQTDPADERQAEFDPPATIHALRGALRALGHQVTLIGNAEALLQRGPDRCREFDLVFNIAEGSHGRCREAWVPIVLELWRIPYVGSSAVTQALALDKVMSKQLARASGLNTPNWCVAEHPNYVSGEVPRFPVIVKPRYEGSGMGISPEAIVSDAQTLAARARWVMERFRQPALIEAFIPFGELTVFVIGNQPPQALPAIQRPLDPATRLSCHVARQPAASAWLCPVDLTPELDLAARHAAVAMFEALQCQDMARVDVRVDEQGRLYVLEINPLPSFDPNGSLGLLAEYLGVTYAQLIGRILDATCSRLGGRDHLIGQLAQRAHGRTG